MKRTILYFLLVFGSSVFLQANNIQVSNISFDEDLGNDIYVVHFDIAWENSWRTSTHESNYDAAWVFLKWKSTNNPEWQHGTIDGINSSPAGCEILAPSDQVGVFVQRSANGIGDVSFENVSLHWLHGEFDADEIVEICVYAIEMVFIPEGPFQVGDGNPLEGTFEEGSSSVPYLITAEETLFLGGAFCNNNNWQTTFIPDDFNSSTIKSALPNYPKGFQSFYSMKYELNQGQYAAFLNSIEEDRVVARYIGNYGDYGQSIHFDGFPITYKAESPDRAANFLSWIDLAAYADWSGLRPMSELEFEKICRGPVDPVENEYAWGNARIVVKEYGYSLSQIGTATEIVLDPGMGQGNAAWFYTLPTSVLRNGIFAASIPKPDRQEAGASYYGVLEMSGNVSELVIGIGTPEGRAFDGDSHGDGQLNTLGVSSWPAINSLFGATIGLGTGTRGGSFESADLLMVSVRSYANSNLSEVRSSSGGGRLVRSNF